MFLFGYICPPGISSRMMDSREGTVSCSLYIMCGDPCEEQLSKAAFGIALEACSSEILEVAEDLQEVFTQAVEKTWRRMSWRKKVD
jgi:hypothetical protein